MAAQECGVKTFLLISTDKAVRPTNIMGATKRIAELVLQAFSHENIKRGRNTLFTMVRFGNVLGSSGSVVPLFKRQISQGGPITVTHPEITRYFMTIPEAVELVIQAGSMAKGGEVFVLDMGEPIKIVDLAQKMVALSGLSVRDKTNPDGDIEIVFTGLRPGEKLYEELLVGNNVVGTRHPMIMRALEDFIPWSQLQKQLNRLESACHSFDLRKVKRILMEIVKEYQPEDEAVDPVWLARVGTIPRLRRLQKLA
jgi:FlaA1/EpsC-like NDP-sugar epimerase